MNSNNEDSIGLKNYEPHPNSSDKNGDTLLHLAAKSAETDAVKRLLDAGVNVNARDKNGRTPLHSAVDSAALAIVQLLLRHPATNLNARMHDGRTPLILASRLAMKDVLEELINAGANINAADDDRNTALHWVAADGRNDPGSDRLYCVQRLLDAGADVNARDKRGRTPLHSAVEIDATPVIRTLLRHPATNLNARMHDGATPLTLASRLAMKATFDLLISKGADVNAADDDGKTSLHWVAAYEGNDTEAARLFVVTKSNSVKRLLAAGANANVQDKDGRTPLHLAVETAALPVIHMLLRHPATNLNALVHDGTTPLILASRFAMKDIFEELISARVDVNYADNDGKTALHWAATSRGDDSAFARSVRPILAKKLLDAGALVNSRDNHGRTPLHSALETAATFVIHTLLCHHATNLNARTHDGATPLISAVRYAINNVILDLIKAGANVHEGDFRGNTALHWAVDLNNAGAVSRLLKYGASVNVRDGLGQTPLHHAAMKGNATLCRVLLGNFANRDLRDELGRLPRDVASQMHYPGIVTLLIKELMPAG